MADRVVEEEGEGADEGPEVVVDHPPSEGSGQSGTVPFV